MSDATLSPFIQAGLKLSERLPLAELDAAAVAAEAGLAAADFTQAYAGLEPFLDALQRHFMDGLRTAVIAATNGQTPGYERAKQGALAYLDGCLARNGLRGWLLQARLQYPLLAENLHKQNRGYLLILPAEFTALRWPHPQAGGRLFLAALQEIARLEQGPGRPNSELRNALWQFLRTYDGR